MDPNQQHNPTPLDLLFQMDEKTLIEVGKELRTYRGPEEFTTRMQRLLAEQRQADK